MLLSSGIYLIRLGKIKENINWPFFKTMYFGALLFEKKNQNRCLCKHFTVLKLKKSLCNKLCVIFLANNKSYAVF